MDPGGFTMAAAQTGGGGDFDVAIAIPQHKVRTGKFHRAVREPRLLGALYNGSGKHTSNIEKLRSGLSLSVEK